MPTLIWSDTSLSRCPLCGREIAVGIMSLCATCPCGAYYVDTSLSRGWYASREAYMRGDARIDTTAAEGR